MGKKPSSKSEPESKLIDTHTQKPPEIRELPKQVTKSKDYHVDHLKDGIPRKKLYEILKNYDIVILKDPKRLMALLRDLCKGQHSREINAIITLLDEQIPQDLLKSKDKIPYSILSNSLQNKLKENTYLSEDLIIWTIDSWASALGIIHGP